MYQMFIALFQGLAGAGTPGQPGLKGEQGDRVSIFGGESLKLTVIKKINDL